MPIQLPEWTLRVAANYDQSRNTKYLLGNKPGGDVGAPTDVPYNGWPNVNVFYMTTDNTVAIKNGGTPTPLTYMMRRTAIQMMQGGDFFTASQRSSSVPFWTAHHGASVPGAKLINHRFAKSTKGAWPVLDTQQGKIAWDAIFKDKIPNAMLKRGSGGWIGSENEPCYWLFNFAPEPQGAGKYFADRHIALHDELVANIGQKNLHIYYDGFPNLNADRYAQRLHGGGIGDDSIISIPATGIVRVPYWNIDLTGLPDVGDGFSDVASLFDGKQPTLLYIKLGVDMTGGNRITGVRHNGTSTTDLRWNTNQNDPANYPSAGDTFGIMNQDRVGYSADWGVVGSPGSPPDGIDEDRIDAGEADVREQAKIDFMTYQSDAMNTRWGYYGWRCCNGLSTSSELRDGVSPWTDDEPSFDNYDWASFESANGSRRFDPWDGTGFLVKFWSVENMVRAMHYGREWLDRSAWDSDYQVFNNPRCEYPFICPAPESGHPDRVVSSNDFSEWVYYSDPSNPESRIFAAFHRFWWGLCMSMSHAFPSASGGGNQADPWVIEEMFYALGRPADEANRNLGTYNRALKGAPAFTYRPPDFGTRGYVTIFEDTIIAINLEEPTVANGGKDANDYWTPSFGASGAACDFDSFLPPNKTAVNFSSADYTCPDTSGARLNYKPGEDPYCGKDPLWNDGQPTGVQLLGPMEVRVAKIVNKWPTLGAHAEFGMYNTRNVDILASPTHVANLKEKDGFVIQTSYPNQSWLDTRYAQFSDIKAANPNCKIMPYIFPYGLDKTPNTFSWQRWEDDLLRSATHGNLGWLLRNGSGVQVEHKADVWATNMADHLVPLNSLGETYAEAYWRKLKNDLSTWGTNNFLDVIDGFYADVARLVPPPQSPGSGDYDEDGTSDPRESTGGVFWRIGHAQWIDRFMTAGWPEDFAFIGNGGTDGYDHDIGIHPLPMTDSPLYNKWHARQSENSGSEWGLEETVDRSAYEITGSATSLGTRLRRLAITEAYTCDDSEHPWGKAFVWHEFLCRQITPDAEDWRFMRVNACIPKGFNKVIYAASMYEKWPPPRLDEHKVDPGEPAAGWQEWGTLNTADATYPVRAPDYTNGAAEFHWFEYENVLWVMRTDYPGDGVWPRGNDATCDLPDPGAGKKWKRIAGTQDPLVNNGTDCTGGTYGQVSLGSWEAIMVQRVDA